MKIEKNKIIFAGVLAIIFPVPHFLFGDADGRRGQ